MTKKRANNRKTNKKNTQPESRYQTIQALRETGESLADRMVYYKARYVEAPVYSSLAFMADMGVEPRQTIDTLVDDSRERLAGLRKDARRKVDEYLKDGRKFYRRARKNPRKAFDSVVEDSRVFFDDLGSEATERMDNLVQSGRDLVENLEKDGRLVADRLRDRRKKALASFSG